MRNRCWRAVAWLTSLALVSPLVAQTSNESHPLDREVEVIVYGGTPAGIAASLAAARDGRTVLLVEPTSRLGGMVTSGLSHTDFHSFEGLTGAFHEFTRRVIAHYEREYGADSPQARGNFRGTHAEPKVNLAVFESWLAEHPQITVLRSHTLKDVQVGTESRNNQRIEQLTVVDAHGKPVSLAAQVFVDASYEGDLMAAAGVPYRVGRESQREFGESLAPEDEDRQLQGYNFRLILTTEPSNRVAIEPPRGYRRQDFAGIVPLLTPRNFVRVFGTLGERVIYKAQEPPLPNNKYDINDVSRGLVRLSLPSENLGWPEGDAATRRQIFNDHLYWNIGLLYFLQNDAEVPEAFQADARKWGLCKDEFTETDHLPPQLYVREARRMRGLYVFTQSDCQYAEDDARAVLRADAIAMGEYGLNCHGTSHEGSRFGGKHVGEFYQPVPPYQIPYGTLVPKHVTNLLVPGAMSASHVGFCALRLEPIWMNLGQAAGHAAAISLDIKKPVQDVPVSRIQGRLHEVGAATIYVSDVLPGNANFAAVQWWGTAGGLHDVSPPPARPGQRGANILGQYYEAYPGHAAELETVLAGDVATRWTELAKSLALPTNKLPPPNGKTTRGDWIRAAYAAKRPATKAP